MAISRFASASQSERINSKVAMPASAGENCPKRVQRYILIGWSVGFSSLIGIVFCSEIVTISAAPMIL